MKQLILFAILIIVPFTAYSAPQFSPLDEFNGGPIIDNKEQSEDIKIPESKICLLDMNTQSSTEIHLMVLDHHISENYSLSDTNNCMWV